MKSPRDIFCTNITSWLVIFPLDHRATLRKKVPINMDTQCHKKKEDSSVTAGQGRSQTKIPHEVTHCISLPSRYNFGSHKCNYLKKWTVWNKKEE